jgi:DNA-binding transcriptional MerR regulator
MTSIKENTTPIANPALSIAILRDLGMSHAAIARYLRLDGKGRALIEERLHDDDEPSSHAELARFDRAQGPVATAG